MFTFDNSYARLPERFYARVTAAAAPEPRTLAVNPALAELLGVDPAWLASPEGARVLSGSAIPEGAEPIALAYAGHQFGAFVPSLGDGRALLLGEIVGRDGRRRDVQLKGSGRTPFSRGGDGRAALGPVLREYVVSEAMAALGIPTTRALAAVETGARVVRDRALAGAVLTRVAASHVRVGTFQYFAARRDVEALELLAGHVISRHHPDAADAENPPLELLDRVVSAHAELVARWLGVGFVHGVMNTDNTSVSGETLDYGPCAFLDEYDPAKKWSSIDHGGRYAFAQQPRVAAWNLSRLAEALLPLVATDPDEAIRLATERLERFAPRFDDAHERVMAAKLGFTEPDDGDAALVERLLAMMAEREVDYTILFRSLSDVPGDPERLRDIAPSFGGGAEDFLAWAEAWLRRLAREATPAEERTRAMRAANPALVPRNHRVEAALVAAEAGDLGPFERLVRALERPYDDQPEYRDLEAAPGLDERVHATFCGT